MVHEVHEPDTFERVEDGLGYIFFGGSVEERLEVDNRDTVGILEKHRCHLVRRETCSVAVQFVPNRYLSD